VTMKAAAQALAVDAKQIRAWLESGELKGYRPTSGPWKIPYAEILALVKRRKKT
jgi:excisionase family DNA binding protein